MITLETLLSFAFIAFFFAPELVDNDKPTRLDELPISCWEKIFSFDESGFDRHCALSCFKISVMRSACLDVAVTNEMIKRCRLAGQKDKHSLHSFFSLFDEEERGGMCSELQKRIELTREIANLDLVCKYRCTEPQEGSDDSEKIELSKLHKKMYRSKLKKEELYCLKQIELLRCYGISIPDSTDTDPESESDSGSESTASTMSTIPEGSEYDLQSDPGSD